jgi:DNA-binding transcriptional regulator YdaS (Cro superfamily)
MNDKIRIELYRHIKTHGGVAKWATFLGIGAPSLYSKLQGRRPMRPHEATILEKRTGGKFSKESLIFSGKP